MNNAVLSKPITAHMQILHNLPRTVMCMRHITYFGVDQRQLRSTAMASLR